MPFTCNINARGKLVRQYTAIVFFALALGVGIWARVAHIKWLWIVVGVLAFIGGFCQFEAAMGWCAIRAMGLKTKI